MGEQVISLAEPIAEPAIVSAINSRNGTPDNSFTMQTLADFDKVGRWGNTLLARRPASGPLHLHKLPTSSESNKERRARENQDCIGGMRSPWRSVRRLPKLQTVGQQMRGILEQVINDNPSLVTIPSRFGEVDFMSADSPLRQAFDAAVTIARHRLMDILKGDSSVRSAEYSRWYAPLVVARIHMAADPDRSLAQWVVEGAPVGVAAPIANGGISPEVDSQARSGQELDLILSYSEPQGNTLSVEKAGKLALQEVDRKM